MNNLNKNSIKKQNKQKEKQKHLYDVLTYFQTSHAAQKHFRNQV